MNVVTEIDKEAKLVTWQDKPNFSIMQYDTEDEDSMPMETLNLGKYFDGLSPRKTGRKFIRFCLHSKLMERINSELKEWTNLQGYNIYKCIIQVERSSTIGWLVYSSQYTDKEHLSKFLEEVTGH